MVVTGVSLEETITKLGCSGKSVWHRSTPACPCDLASLARVPFRSERGWSFRIDRLLWVRSRLFGYRLRTVFARDSP